MAWHEHFVYEIIIQNTISGIWSYIYSYFKHLSILRAAACIVDWGWHFELSDFLSLSVIEFWCIRSKVS